MPTTPSLTDLLDDVVLAEDVAAFLLAGKTGQITLDVLAGKVQAYHLNTYRRVTRAGADGSVGAKRTEVDSNRSNG